MAVDAERWATLPTAEQMANIGSEVGRTAKWISKGKTDLARECFNGAFLSSDIDMLKYLDKYFTQFAAICRR